MGLTTTKNKLTKILVVRDDNAFFSHCTSKDRGIVRLEHFFCDGQNIVPDLAQKLRNCYTC